MGAARRVLCGSIARMRHSCRDLHPSLGILVSLPVWVTLTPMGHFDPYSVPIYRERVGTPCQDCQNAFADGRSGCMHCEED